MTKEIDEQLHTVRETARTNMFDWRGIANVADDLQLYALYVWVVDKANQPELVEWVFGRVVIEV